jgi:hypothetical protein
VGGASRYAGRAGAAAFIGALGLGPSLFAGCSAPCCTVDGFPINLVSPPSTSPEAGGLRAAGWDPGDQARFPNLISIDTGSSLTIFRGHDEGNQVVLRNLDLLDALPAPGGTVAAPVRARFRDIEALPVDIDPEGPDVVLGGELLRNYSVQFDFAAPSITFWSRQSASDGFLGTVGFAVLRFNLAGGAELIAQSRPDFLGLTGPVETHATRVVLRACSAWQPFDPDTEPQEHLLCCKKGDEGSSALAAGADLALLVATGVGPLVLSQSAWDRVTSNRDSVPVATRTAPLPVASLSGPIMASWFSLPRLALVNQELDDSSNPGACVELGRARRLEWVEHHQADAACAQPCDTDPRDSTRAQNSAAYIELGDDIPVAVVPDGTPLLQGLRAEIRPEGPEIDGLIGAGTLASTTLEIDYRSQPARALLACVAGAPQGFCWTRPRCARLSNPGDTRACFGQPARALPAVCAPSGCG